MVATSVRPHLAFAATPVRLGRRALCAFLAVVCFAPAWHSAARAAQAGDSGLGTAPAQSQPAAAPQTPAKNGGMTETELKQLVTGKTLFLRGNYLGDTLSFDEHGRLIGQSPQGSFTLCVLQIDKARLTRHKVELEGTRYGLHFLGQLAFEEPSSAFDRVRITPRKKVVKITIDREMVVKPKKVKEARTGKEAEAGGEAGASKDKSRASRLWAWTTARSSSAAPAAPATPEPRELSEAEQLKASIAATPEAERPADPASVTTTTSPAHARRVLTDAIGQIFAPSIDERMIAAMPGFWKLYYQAVAGGVDYQPKDPAILRQRTVDRKAVLLTTFEPDSNEFAQADGVAGMAQYHAVIEPDGTVGEIAVGRPIGFGLDEIAVAAIRKASFQPAIKDGKPVAVMVDLDVPFRIFSKLTDVHSPPGAADKPAAPVLPGPYSVLGP